MCLGADVCHCISFKQFSLLNVSHWQKISSEREVAQVSGWAPAGLEEPFSNTTYTPLFPLFSLSCSVPLLPPTSVLSVNPHIHWVCVKCSPYIESRRVIQFSWVVVVTELLYRNISVQYRNDQFWICSQRGWKTLRWTRVKREIDPHLSDTRERNYKEFHFFQPCTIWSEKYQEIHSSSHMKSVLLKFLAVHW